MTKEEVDYSLQLSLRNEFDKCNKTRAIEIYETSKFLNFEEQAEEMKEDLEIEFNLEL